MSNTNVIENNQQKESPIMIIAGTLQIGSQRNSRQMLPIELVSQQNISKTELKNESTTTTVDEPKKIETTQSQPSKMTKETDLPTEKIISKEGSIILSPPSPPSSPSSQSHPIITSSNSSPQLALTHNSTNLRTPQKVLSASGGFKSILKQHDGGTSKNPQRVVLSPGDEDHDNDKKDRRLFRTNTKFIKKEDFELDGPEMEALNSELKPSLQRASLKINKTTNQWDDTSSPREGKTTSSSSSKTNSTTNSTSSSPSHFRPRFRSNSLVAIPNDENLHSSSTSSTSSDKTQKGVKRIKNKMIRPASSSQLLKESPKLKTSSRIANNSSQQSDAKPRHSKKESCSIS